MIKYKLSITQISLIFTSILSVALIIVSSVYSHQISVLKRGYQIQSENLQICQKNIFYQEECQTNQQEECPKQDCNDCPKQDCDQCTCPTPTKSSNIFLLEGTYNNQPYQKVVKFQIANSNNADYTIKEVCTEEQDQDDCQYSPDNIIILNADGELELTINTNTPNLLSNDATTTGDDTASESTTQTTTTWSASSWGMPWSKNAIKVNLPVYASESDVLLQKDIQKIKSSSNVGQIEVQEEIGTVSSSSIDTVTSKSTTNINIDTINQITSNIITNIMINEPITKKATVANNESILDGIRQLSSSENGITYINSPKIDNISSKTIETINIDYALSIKLKSVGLPANTTNTTIEITDGVSGLIKIGGDITCNSETGACINLVGTINNNGNNGQALSVSGKVNSPILFSKDSVVSKTFTNEGTFSDVVNTGTFNSVQNTGTITNGITNNKGTIGDITNQADSKLGSVNNGGQMESVSNTGTMTASFTNSGTLSGSIINKGTANNMKNEGGTITNGLQIIGGTLTNGLQINGGTIGSTSTTSGLSINGETTIQGSQVGILIGSDGSKDDIKIQTSGGTYGILMQQATIGHTGLHRGINIDRRESYSANSPWVNIYSRSDEYNGQASYAIFVGSNNVILHSSTSGNRSDKHKYYYTEPQIRTNYWPITLNMHYGCTASDND